MQKDSIVAALRELADLLEITGASSFEFRAMRNAAQSVDDWDGDIEQQAADGNLQEIPSVGKGIAQIIKELCETGESEELKRVRGLVPDELPMLLRFRGLGPKRVRTLWQELEIESPADLKSAIDDGRVQSLKGFGAKTIETMLSSIEYFANVPAEKGERTDLSADVVRQAPQASGQVFAGTSGYSYPQWSGSFYEDDAKTEDLLTHYAAKLHSVEINNTFYRFPSKEVVADWQARTPANFRFALKAHRQVTHQKRLSEASKKNIIEFVQRGSELGERLGCILYQFPPDFARDDDRLQFLIDTLPVGPRYALEFRHDSWFDDAIFDQLREANIALVSGDAENEPEQKYVTADFLYVRLRRPAYTEQELDAWGAWIQEHTTNKKDAYIFLKHDDTGAAPTSVQDRWT